MRDRLALLAPAVIAAAIIGSACNDATSPKLDERPSHNSSDSDTECVGILPPGTYQNVVVPPGASCRVEASIVLGNIKALERSQLVAQDNDIRGNVELLSVRGASIRLNTIGGNVFAEKFGGGFTINRNHNISGNITLTEGNAAFVDISGNRLPHGNIEVQKSTVNLLYVGAGRGNILDEGNIKVEENTIGEEMFTDNNRVAQDLQVFRNTGPGFKSVTGNTVGENLQCFENVPPFVGGPNAARQAEGQCFAG